MEFSPDGYRELLSGFRAAGYQFRLFGDEIQDRHVLLRHDIDFSVELATELAQIEHENGVVSTFFFLLTSNFYNPLSCSNRTLIESIAKLGHAVSLHFDASIYADIDAGFALERSTFESAFGSLRVVSLHRPCPFLQNNNRKLSGCQHTYQDELFKDIQYFSDSGGAFNYGEPFDSVAFKSGRPIHLLIHPIWWTTQRGSASNKLREWKADHMEFLRREMGRNCKTFDGRGLIHSPSEVE